MATQSRQEEQNLPAIAQQEPAEERADNADPGNAKAIGTENYVEPDVASVPAADPIQLLRERANFKRSFTCIAKQVKKAIVDYAPLQQVETLHAQVNNLYDDALAAHLEYCGSINKYDDAWTAALDSARGEIHQLMIVYRQADHGPEITEQPPGSERRRSARLRGATIDVTPLPRPVSVSSQTRKVNEVANRTAHSHAPRSVANESTSSRFSRLGSQRGSSEASIRSLSSRSSLISNRSALSTLTRQRMEAELELKIIQKRREEDLEEEARLADLQRKLAEGKRRMESRKLERKVEEEVARLRMSENLARRLAEQPDSDLAVDEPEVSRIDRFNRGDMCESKPVALAVVKASHDAWISELKGAETGATGPNQQQAQFMPWNVYGAGYACTKPFDGDPREWPLFVSRFRALVHNVVPDDAQRIAILADWLGPSVKRRVETANGTGRVRCNVRILATTVRSA